jgi:putative ABC transport system substrate-binding protein
MNRRNLLPLLSGAAAARPIAVRAQRSGPVRIGYLSPGRKDTEDNHAFFEELTSLGYIEGRNLAIDFDESGESPERLPALVAEMVRAPVDLIVAPGSEPVARAARDATGSIPIVLIAINYDPVERDYAKSLAHPGGNLTGVFFRSIEIAGKQVELLKQMVPQASRLTVLWGPEVQDEFAAAADGARAQGLAIRSLQLGAPPYDFDAMFGAAADEASPLVLVLSTPAFASHHKEVAAAALRHRIAAMFRYRSYVEAGGLMSYGVDNLAMRRLAARYVAKILGGIPPADLPIQRADKFELVINAKTAEMLGLTVPPLLRARADEVIE